MTKGRGVDLTCVIVAETGNKEASSLPLTVNSGGSGGGPDLERRDEAEDGATAVAADATLLEKTAAACAEPAVPDEPQQTVDIKVIYNKTKYEVSVSLGSTVGELKRQLVGLLGVPEKNQKLMFKGLLRDDQSLSSAGVTRGSKLMVVGSKPTDIMAVTSVRAQELQQELERPTTSKEPLSKQKIHRKILDKGVPEDAMPGIKNAKVSITGVPLLCPL